MPRRVYLRLVLPLVVACAGLVPVAAAQAAPPGNDSLTTPQLVSSLAWTSLSAPQDIIVQATDWGDATTGPEDASPLPSCTGAPGFRSMWYSVPVTEAAVLRVTVISTDPVRYQPVVNILGNIPGSTSLTEVACGLANDVKQGSAANATAYVTPNVDGTPATYLVRVAEVVNNSPVLGLPTLTVRFAARDVTPPRISVQQPTELVQPHDAATYTALGSKDPSTDLASGINDATAQWVFHDRDKLVSQDGHMSATYKWQSSGSHEVEFKVSDRAGNASMYRFYTYVQDTIRPQTKFSMVLPQPGSRRLRIILGYSESVSVRLLVTEVGKRQPLYRHAIKFWGTSTGKGHSRSIPLKGIIGRGVLVVSGVARDRSGNTAALGQCWVDPVAGTGSCTQP